MLRLREIMRSYGLHSPLYIKMYLFLSLSFSLSLSLSLSHITFIKPSNNLLLRPQGPGPVSIAMYVDIKSKKILQEVSNRQRSREDYVCSECTG